MATAATSLLGLALPVTGELSGTWGDTVNTSITALLDSAVAGTTTLSTDADVTLTTTTLAANQAREAILLWTAAGTVTRTITAPAQSKTYVVINSSSTQSIKLVGAGPTAGITVLPGESTYAAWNGSDFVKVGEYGGNLTVNSLTTTASTTGSTNKGPLNYGTLSFSDTGIVQSAQTSVNSYFQNAIQNTSAGTAASAEFIAYNDQGTAATNYATVGINSSGYTGTGSINAPGYAYFLSASTDLVLGTIGANGIHFTTNSSATDALAISSAGAVSLPGGTANGVAYLNGSKVVTTGSALTFSGTTLAVNGTAPGFSINDTTAVAGVSFSWFNSGPSYSYGQIALRDTTNSQTAYTYFAGASGYHNWYQNGSEQMRLTSTGLGIGTSSPGSKLDILGTTPFVRLQENTTGYLGFRGQNTSGNFYFGIDSSAGGFYGSAYARVLYSDGAYPMVFYTNATERMRLDSSGNLGVGTSSPNAKVQASGSGSISFRATTSDGGGVNLDATVTGSSVEFGSPNGVPIVFKNSATEKMRLTTGGTLLLGATATQANETMRVAVSGVQNSILVSNSASTNGAFYSAYNDAALIGVNRNPTSGAIINTSNYTADIVLVGSSTTSYISFETSSAANSAPTERMRLDTSGNLGLGVTPSAWNTFKAFEVGGLGSAIVGSSTVTTVSRGAYYATGWKYAASGYAMLYSQNNNGAGEHAWYTAPSGTAGNAISFTQAMTLDASGELLVGTTAGYNGEKMILGYSGNGMALRNGGSGTLNDIIFLRGTSTVVGTIQTTASSTLYNTTSDYRLKIINGPVTNSGAFIDKLNPVQGSWKADGSRFIGFLAHELQEASETIVGGGVKDGEEMQSIDYSNAELIANLVAEIQDLRKRLAALEAK